MKNVKAVELENGQWIYMQVDEDINVLPSAADSVDDGFEHKGFSAAPQVATKIGDLVHSMADMAATTIKTSALGNMEKLTLEFSVTLGGELGIPLVSSGKAEGSVNIKIEFAKPKPNDSK